MIGGCAGATDVGCSAAPKNREGPLGIWHHKDIANIVAAGADLRRAGEIEAAGGVAGAAGDFHRVTVNRQVATTLPGGRDEIFAERAGATNAIPAVDQRGDGRRRDSIVADG